MKQKINCERARNISIIDILAKIGYFPIKESEKEAWFLSPFRSETQASFKISKRLNRWYDHGKGMGGNVIDLVCQVLNCSVQDALSFLNDDISYFSFQQQPILFEQESAISIIRVKEIKHPALIQYLSSRGISLIVAHQFCKEVWYQYKDKQYFAIGLKNHLCGWELRNKFFKNSCSPKSYSYFKSSNNQLLIVEGMFDLLSLVVLKKELIPTSDIIVLNSISFINDIVSHLDNYTTINLYLDNDRAGRKATEFLLKTDSKIIDKSSLYKDYKDLNEFLSHG